MTPRGAFKGERLICKVWIKLPLTLDESFQWIFRCLGKYAGLPPKPEMSNSFPLTKAKLMGCSFFIKVIVHTKLMTVWGSWKIISPYFLSTSCSEWCDIWAQAEVTETTKPWWFKVSDKNKKKWLCKQIKILLLPLFHQGSSKASLEPLSSL